LKELTIEFTAVGGKRIARETLASIMVTFILSPVHKVGCPGIVCLIKLL